MKFIILDGLRLFRDILILSAPVIGVVFALVVFFMIVFAINARIRTRHVTKERADADILAENAELKIRNEYLEKENGDLKDENRIFKAARLETIQLWSKI